MKTPITFKNIFVSILSLLISITSFVTLTTHLNSQAAEPTQFVWVDKAKATSPLYTTVAGNETANFSIYDTTNGILCSVELSRKPDNAEIKYTIDKTNIGKGWMPYVLNPKLVKAGRIITYTSDRLIVEGNATTFKTSTSTKKYRRSDRKYSTKPLTDVKPIDKKYLDACYTTGGIKSVEKMFKDEKGIFFKLSIVNSNLIYLTYPSIEYSNGYSFSVLNKITGNFCNAYYSSLANRYDDWKKQNIIIEKGTIPLDILKKSSYKIQINNLKKTNGNYFNLNSTVDADRVSIKYYGNSTNNISLETKSIDIYGYVVPVNEVNDIPLDMLDDCMKTNGIQNAMDTYSERFKEDKIVFTEFSSNLTYLSETSESNPNDYQYSVLDNSTGQFCRAYYSSRSRRSWPVGQEISIIKGKIPLDILNNISETKIIKNFKNENVNQFQSNTKVDTDYVTINYFANSTNDISKGIKFHQLAGVELPLKEVPDIASNMLNNCIKIDGMQNAYDTYSEKFKNDKINFSEFSSNLTYLSETETMNSTDYVFSVLDNSTGQFCRAVYPSLSNKYEYYVYQSSIEIKKGKIPLDIIKYKSINELRNNPLKNKNTNYLFINTEVDSERVSIVYNENSTTKFETFNLSHKVQGFEVILSEIPKPIQEILSNCMKIKGIQNALDTYQTVFKNDKINFTEFSSNITYLTETTFKFPYEYIYTAFDKSSRQFCRSRISPSTSAIYDSGKDIEIIKGILPLDIIKNVSKTSLRRNDRKDKNTNYFMAYSYVDSENILLKAREIKRVNKKHYLQGFEVPLNEIPLISKTMLSGCMKINGMQNAFESYRIDYRW